LATCGETGTLFDAFQALLLGLVGDVRKMYVAKIHFSNMDANNPKELHFHILET
jgi:hypothetical protein